MCPRVPELGAPMNVMATAISSTAIMVTWTHPMFMNTIDDYFLGWEPTGLPSGVLLQGGSTQIFCYSANQIARKRSVLPLCTEIMSFNITGLEEYINYNVSVSASNSAGNGARGFDTALTMPAGACTHIVPEQTHCVQILCCRDSLLYVRTYICMCVCVLG